MKPANRITPTHISSLEPNQVFVFGSNLAGRHGRGAAKTAMKWGAIYGHPSGLQGKTYAIPTKDASAREPLPIATIQMYVDEFIDFAKGHPELTFIVTEIGCGLAHLTPREIAPLFAKAKDVENIWLPQRFWNYLLMDAPWNRTKICERTLEIPAHPPEDGSLDSCLSAKE